MIFPQIAALHTTKPTEKLVPASTTPEPNNLLNDFLRFFNASSDKEETPNNQDQ